MKAEKICSKKIKPNKQTRRRKEIWKTILSLSLPPGYATPQWVSTEQLNKSSAGLYASMFWQEASPIESYLPYASSFQQNMPGIIGVVVEGCYLDRDKRTQFVNSGVCEYLLIYHTPSWELGRPEALPHLRRWGTETGGATHEAVFALRLVLNKTLSSLGLPSVLVRAAKQHNTEKADLEQDTEPVTWELTCEFRDLASSVRQFQEKQSELSHALRCDWVEAEAGDNPGGFQLWISNTPQDRHLPYTQTGSSDEAAKPG